MFLSNISCECKVLKDFFFFFLYININRNVQNDNSFIHTSGLKCTKKKVCIFYCFYLMVLKGLGNVGGG